MPNNYVDNKAYWDDLSDLDYISAFVKAWLAFNAWYRSHYNLRSDREILDEIKFTPNSVKNRSETLLKTSVNDRGKRFKLDQDAMELRSEIALLHDRLEKHPLMPFDKKRSTYKRISMTDVFLRKITPIQQRASFRKLLYEVDPITNGGQIQKIEIRVSDSRGNVKFYHIQTKFDEKELTSQSSFISALNHHQSGQLLALYRNVNPECFADLTNYTADEIECDSYLFKCSSEDLFAGTMETLYSMRCMLFHGELVPSRDAKLCYEPAYRILKKFLSFI